MDEFDQSDMEESLAVNAEEKRKYDTEFWEKHDSRFAELLNQVQSGDEIHPSISKD